MATSAEKVPIGQENEGVLQEKNSPSSDAGGDEEITSGVNESALLRKLDFKLLPAVSLLYLLSFLDRSNGKTLACFRSRLELND
jgi:hypothetical protein